MAEESLNSGLVRIGQQTIARYSGVLVKRSLEELKTRAPSALLPLQKKKRALLIHARDQYPEFITELLGEAGLEVDLVECYNQEHFDNIVTKFSTVRYDLVLPTNLGLSPWYIPELVSAIKKIHPETKILVASGYCELPFAIDLKRRGIDDFFSLPYDPDELLRRVSELITV